MRELQISGDLAVGYARDEPNAAVLQFSERARDGDAYADIVELLGLTPGLPHYTLSLALGSAGSDTIALQTRSLNGVLYYLAHGVEVPDTHRNLGLVTRTSHADGRAFDWSELMSGLFTIGVADSRPDLAAVSVPYRDYWFYISDTDLSTKSTFSLLTQLFELQAGGSESMRPVLTIPVGG